LFSHKGTIYEASLTHPPKAAKLSALLRSTFSAVLYNSRESIPKGESIMKRVASILVLIMLCTVLALADVAKPTKSPGRKKSISTNMMIHLQRDAKEARLIIPRSQIKQLRAQLDGLDISDDINTATFSGPRTQTIVSGLFLSLAIIFGGIWFARSGKASTASGKTLVILTVLAGMASAASFALANVGPPPEARSITGKMFSQAVHVYGFGSGNIKLEAGDVDFVELIVPDPRDETKPSE
jgi:preprotein translocase subunit SecG